MISRLHVLTNATAARQISMEGYGNMVLAAAESAAIPTQEIRGSSILSQCLPNFLVATRFAKMLRNIDRLVMTPLSLAGKRCDIIHVVDPGNSIYLLLLRYRKSVVTVHDTIPYLAQSGALSGFKPTTAGKLLMKWMLYCLRKADHIICVSNSSRNELLKLGQFDQHKISTIHNPPIRNFRRASIASQLALRTSLSIPADAPVILHVGAAFYKNRRAVYEVFRLVKNRCPNAHLLLVGGDATERSVMNAPDTIENVRFLTLPVDQVVKVAYSLSAVLLFPSLHEGFGFPVIEAQSCGTPVVCSDRGALPEVAGEGALFCRPDDSDGMASCVLSIIRDESKADALRTAGHINAGRFSVGKWGGEICELYSKL